AETAWRRRVDADVHLLGAVAERAELVRREERGPRERGLTPHRAIELDRVPAALMALQRQLVAGEDHVGPDVLRARLGFERRERFVGDPRRVPDEIPLREDFPAAGVLIAESIGIGADLQLAVADGLGRDAAADLSEPLLNVRALGREEQLVFAPDRI